MLTAGSLFSGGLALDMAVESVLGARTVWTCDVDRHVRRLLAHRAPWAPNLTSVYTRVAVTRGTHDG